MPDEVLGLQVSELIKSRPHYSRVAVSVVLKRSSERLRQLKLAVVSQSIP